MIRRPEPSEHTPYFARYVTLVPGDDLFRAYDSETAATRSLLASITEEDSLRRYAPGKWSIREMLLHVMDTERIFGYRALRFARGDATPLEGFEQDDLIPASGADARSWKSLLDEHTAVRASTRALLESLEPAAFDRTGLAGGNHFSVRAIAWAIVGHEIHHRNVLRERYL
jgi:uncharacterized damage-inducible protein DinB